MELMNEKEGVDYSYSCLMWNVPEFYKDLILSWAHNAIPDNVLYVNPEDPGSSGREDDTHLTIKYGIHTHDPEEVQTLVKGFGAFPVEFGLVSKFPGKGYEVIKIEVDGEKLRELNKLVSGNLKCTDSYPDYKPHVTLAYVKQGSCDHLMGKPIFKDVSISATELVLSVPGEEKQKFNIEIT